jgi:hypothetical protein
MSAPAGKSACSCLLAVEKGRLSVTAAAAAAAAWIYAGTGGEAAVQSCACVFETAALGFSLLFQGLGLFACTCCTSSVVLWVFSAAGFAYAAWAVCFIGMTGLGGCMMSLRFLNLLAFHSFRVLTIWWGLCLIADIIE